MGKSYLGGSSWTTWALVLFLLVLTMATTATADNDTHALRQYLKNMHKVAGSETVQKRTPEEQAAAMKGFQQRFEEYRVAKEEAYGEQPFFTDSASKNAIDEEEEQPVKSKRPKKTMRQESHHRHQSPQHYSQSTQQARAIQDFRQHLKASRSAWLEQTKQQIMLQAEQ
mmetsp:Transcript_10188/g.19640  ORF Transcript_10188/g.19640 Transcript_10188/m.19640 type:complete len:169 (-) Transcript_10188:118-624(-)